MTTPKWLTFDAYGTLVDFALDQTTVDVLESRLDGIDVDAFLKRYQRIRFEETFGTYKPYRDVLRRSLKRIATEFNIVLRDGDGDALIAAVPTYGPFPDVPPVLERLRQHCKLAIISNTENDLFQGNLDKLGVPIDRVLTAEQIGAYKPSLFAFRYMLRELDVSWNEVVHIAQGFDYDIRPAHEIGLNKIWINRRGLRGDPVFRPWDELPDLTGVPEQIGISS